MCCAGYFVVLSSIPVWLRWIQHISAVKYGNYAQHESMRVAS